MVGKKKPEEQMWGDENSLTYGFILDNYITYLMRN